MDSWSARDEVLRSVNQWYLIFAFIVIGGLFGFLFDYLIPSPFQAMAEIYIGIDITRVNEMESIIPLASSEQLNLDDYKNWQLKQVAGIMLSDMVLEDTLVALQEIDPSWTEISLEELREVADIYWYDAGLWQLEIVFPDDDQATLAVQTWLDSGHEIIRGLLEASDRVAVLDAQLQSTNTAIGIVKERIAGLETFLSSSEEWIVILSEFSQADPLDEEVQEELKTWINIYTQGNLSWQVSLENFPEPEQGVAAYLIWLKVTQLSANAALLEGQSRLLVLEIERAEILPSYHEELENSLGLSANLILQPNSSVPVTRQVRSTDVLTLGGGFLGLLTWLLVAVFRIRGSREKHE
jgi:hypothetical protein